MEAPPVIQPKPDLVRPIPPTPGSPWILVVAVGFACFVGGALIGGAIVRGLSMRQTSAGLPQPARERFLENGWASFRLGRMGMRLELPGYPMPSPARTPDHPYAAALDVVHFDATSGHLYAHILGREPANGTESTLERDANAVVTANRKAKFEDYSDSQAPVKLGGVPAIRIDMVYRDRQRNRRSHTVEYVAHNGRMVDYIRLSYWFDDPAGEAAAKRVVDSVRFLAPQE